MDYGYGNPEDPPPDNNDDTDTDTDEVDAMDVVLLVAEEEPEEQAAAAEQEDSMGYEECVPQPRRRHEAQQQQQSQRRASIQAVLADARMSPMAKRLSIQHLMDGRRFSLTASHCGSSSGGGADGSASPSPSLDGGAAARRSGGRRHSAEDGATAAAADLDYYGYGDAAPDADGDNHHSYSGDGSGDGGEPPAAAAAATMMMAICNDQTHKAESARPPCHHYDRRCTLVAPCCGAAFGCRICHDECPALPPKINNGGKRYHRSASLPCSFTHMAPRAQLPEDNHHTIDRFAVREIICRDCFTRQSSKTNNCVSCGVRFGEYHCDICNLWMSDEESPYHCADCGFCRVGGHTNFQHCRQCGMCIDRGLYASHNCKAGKYRSNCPVCQEYLFSSRGASHEMPCGHAIHWDCFRQLAAHDSRCPVCKKTAETRDRMMPTWNAMAADIARQPVPAELARVVILACNDCERSEDARAWHFLGMQCSHCQSFNTVVDRIVLQGEEAHEFLEASRRRAALLAEQQQAQEQPQGGGDPPHPPSGGQRRRFNRRRSAF